MSWIQNVVSILAGGLAVYVLQRNAATTPSLPVQPSAHNQTVKPPFRGWDFREHLGGYSPWRPKVDGTIVDEPDLPPHCMVQQVHMIARHAERYPTVVPGMRMIDLYYRLGDSNVTFLGDLAFVPSWAFFAPAPATQFEHVTSTGPHAGTLTAFSHGVAFRERYSHLLESAMARENPIKFWASRSTRVIDSARLFAAGFFGLDWDKPHDVAHGRQHQSAIAHLIIIDESPARGADSLTPKLSCPNYAEDQSGQGAGLGITQHQAFLATYLPAISARLHEQNPEIRFSNEEIYTMQELCAFETLLKGHSPWCDIFSDDEWRSFEYARDLLYYYRTGPGNEYGASLGQPWVNATAELIAKGPEDAGELFLSFAHDGDIVATLAALDLFPQTPALPTTHILSPRTWQMSDVVPMSARLVLERIACAAPQACWDNGPLYPNHIYCTPPRNDTFVRIRVNDGIVPLPACAGARSHPESQPAEQHPGNVPEEHTERDTSAALPGACPLETFLAIIRARTDALGSFAETCGLGLEQEGRVKFLRQ